MRKGVVGYFPPKYAMIWVILVLNIRYKYGEMYGKSL